MIVGIGTDLVDIPAFAEQLQMPGSVFRSHVFTAREWRTVVARVAEKHGDVLREDDPLPYAAFPHFAVRWAAKEAVIKAWSDALFGTAPPLREEEVNWREIEVIHDRWHRPSIRLHGQISRLFSTTINARRNSTQGGAFNPAGHPHSLGKETDIPSADLGLRWHLSLSHDGPFALAYVLIDSSH